MPLTGPWSVVMECLWRERTLTGIWLVSRGAPFMLKFLLCRSARKRYLLCSAFVPIMLIFFQLCSSKYSNFAMISVIQLVIINIINFILLIFSQSYDKILNIIN